ncbi:MAG: Na/Pi cotransporter family protein [Endomicrobiales bacterium]|nr:Na/Pi cotransporter family protein [Endomicrobiales bacterium]
MKKNIIISFILFFIFYQPSFAGHKIKKISGDNQFGITGYPLKKDFVVQVLSEKGKPQTGIPVSFVIISQPELPLNHRKSSESALSTTLCVTDEEGYAKSRLNLGHPQSGEVLVGASTGKTIGNPAVFKVTAQKKYWILLLILGIFGGLGLFLFGIFYLNNSLRKIAGKKLREILITLTGSPFKGIGTGFFVTMLNQASSATTVLEVSLVSAGLLTFYQSMAVTMGAEIGSTITAQIVAFRISNYAILIVGLGFYLTVLSKSRIWKRIGDTILGLGLVFFGIKIMSDLFMPMHNYGPFIDVMKNLENPFFGMLIGLLFTAVVRSSGITSGIIISLALAEAITLYQAIPVVLGSQIGTCLNAVIASIGRNREARRAALWHMFHQIAGAIIVFPFLILFYFKSEPLWIYFVKWFTHAFLRTNELARQIAVSHTLAALLNAVIFFPLLPLMNKLFCRILPSKEQEKPFGPIYIDDEFLETPSLALEQAKKEIAREGEVVLSMMKQLLRVFETQDFKLAEAISLQEIHADVLRNSIVPYLSKLGQGSLEEEQLQQENQLLFIVDDIESIGDIVDKNILPLIHKKLENNLWFSDEGWKDIVDLHAMVINNFESLLSSIKSGNLEQVKLIIEKKSELNIYQSELRKRHISRLHSGVQESLETSSVHLDLIDQLKSINSHITAICYTLINGV